MHKRGSSAPLSVADIEGEAVQSTRQPIINSMKMDPRIESLTLSQAAVEGASTIMDAARLAAFKAATGPALEAACLAATEAARSAARIAAMEAAEAITREMAFQAALYAAEEAARAAEEAKEKAMAYAHLLDGRAAACNEAKHRAIELATEAAVRKIRSDAEEMSDMIALREAAAAANHAVDSIPGTDPNIRVRISAAQESAMQETAIAKYIKENIKAAGGLYPVEEEEEQPPPPPKQQERSALKTAPAAEKEKSKAAPEDEKPVQPKKAVAISSESERERLKMERSIRIAGGLMCQLVEGKLMKKAGGKLRAAKDKTFAITPDLKTLYYVDPGKVQNWKTTSRMFSAYCAVLNFEGPDNCFTLSNIEDKNKDPSWTIQCETKEERDKVAATFALLLHLIKDHKTEQLLQYALDNAHGQSAPNSPNPEAPQGGVAA